MCQSTIKPARFKSAPAWQVTHHEKGLGRVKVMVRLVNQDKEAVDGQRDVVQRVLQEVVGPMAHAVQGWDSPPDVYVENRVNVQRLRETDAGLSCPKGTNLCSSVHRHKRLSRCYHIY